MANIVQSTIAKKLCSSWSLKWRKSLIFLGEFLSIHSSLLLPRLSRIVSSTTHIYQVWSKLLDLLLFRIKFSTPFSSFQCNLYHCRCHWHSLWDRWNRPNRGKRIDEKRYWIDYAWVIIFFSYWLSICFF